MTGAARRRIVVAMRTVLMLVVLGCGCGSPVLSDVDAGRDGAARVDSSVADAPAEADVPARDAAVDAVADGGRDAASVDAPPTPDAGWGDCNLFAQTGCSSGEACRRAARTDPPFVTPHDGPPACEPSGALMEERSLPGGGCRNGDGSDACRAGLFCQSWGACERYCDPAGAACPDVDGAAQTCVTDGPAGVPYCRVT